MKALCLIFVLSLVMPFLVTAQVEKPAVYPNTEPLTWTGDIASRLVDACDQFLLNEIESTQGQRAAHWQRDLSSHEAYVKSVATNRERFVQKIGLRDSRTNPPRLEKIGERSDGEGYRAWPIRWETFPLVHGEGLLLEPNVPAKGLVIYIPDADQTPETLANSPEVAGLVRASYRVGIPQLINRGTMHRKLSNREFLYRSAFELGRHLIGYEVAKVTAIVDWAEAQQVGCEITVFGQGEGALLAFYAGAADPRIDRVIVRGYFGSRQALWKEPAYRNVFGLLPEFGDAEIASLIVPRELIIDPTPGPEITVPPGTGGKPGRIVSPAEAEARAELERLRGLISELRPEPKLRLTTQALTDWLGQLPQGSQIPLPVVDSEARHRRQMDELDQLNQRLLTESPYVRAEFMKKLKFDSLAAYEESAEHYREVFAKEVIGQFNHPLLNPNPRSRKCFENTKVVGYEVVLDVFPGLFAYGILLVPKEVKPGERRPVVVCQHGLEGRPQALIGETGYSSYKSYATRLAERGYITFAPQNIYIFEDRFRTLQFKANSIGKTLFSLMVPQHQQITNWLSQLDIVDPKRIAFYGLSYGGKSAMRIPPLVKNYCLSICSADFNEWVWKNASSRSSYSYVWSGEYEIFEFDLGSTFNYAEMAALIAPRPFMVERGHFDGVAPDETVAYEFGKVRYLYEAKLGLGDRAEIEWFVGPHTINGQGSFRFLDKHLGWTAR